VKYRLERWREVVMRCDGGGAFASSSMRDLQALREEEEQGGVSMVATAACLVCKCSIEGHGC
jgi:hypothetical protein